MQVIRVKSIIEFSCLGKRGGSCAEGQKSSSEKLNMFIWSAPCISWW